MNKKITLIKKRLVSACNKLINTQQAKSSDATENKKQIKKNLPQKLRLKSVSASRKHNHTYSTMSTISSIRSTSRDVNQGKPCVATSSSGYGTSVKSAMSVFINLDNYFFDENFSNIKMKAQENAKVMKSNIVQCLLDYQIEYLEILKYGLENVIRPLSALMNSNLFGEIFQNIEKIYAMGVFIKNSINDSYYLTQDLFTSTLAVISEYIAIIVDTYEIYLKGYAKSESAINDVEFNELMCGLNDTDLLRDFDLEQFIDLPIKNVTKLYCAFMSLQDITSMSEQHDYERISVICNQIKTLIGPSSDVSLSSDVIESENELCKQIFSSGSEQSVRSKQSKTSGKSVVLPKDFVDETGKKYYFV